MRSTTTENEVVNNNQTETSDLQILDGGVTGSEDSQLAVNNHTETFDLKFLDNAGVTGSEDNFFATPIVGFTSGPKPKQCRKGCVQLSWYGECRFKNRLQKIC